MEKAFKIRSVTNKISNRNLIAAIAIFIYAIITYFVSCQYWDSDNWWIMATGKDILENGIPYKNTFFMIENELDIVVQQWLVCVINYSAFNLLGDLGLYLLVFVESLILLMIIYKYAVMKGVDKRLALLYGVFTLIAMIHLITLRPSMLTIILIITQFIFMESENKKLRWLIPFLVVLEANIHASFIVLHFLALLPFTVPCPGRHINRNTETLKVLPLYPLMALGALCNPYGLNGALYLYNSFNIMDNKLNIMELGDLPIISMGGASIIITLLTVTVLTTLMLVKKIKIKSSDLTFFLGMLAMFIMEPSIRNWWFPVLGAVPYITTAIAGFSGRVTIEKSRIKINYSICIIVMSLMIMTGSAMTSILNAPINDSPETPHLACDYLMQNEKDKNYTVFTHYNNGGVFAFYGIPIFVDARPELYSPEIGHNNKNVIDAYRVIDSTLSDRDRTDALAEYNFDYIFAYKNAQLYSYMEERKDYKRAVESELYVLYKKK